MGRFRCKSSIVNLNNTNILKIIFDFRKHLQIIDGMKHLAIRVLVVKHQEPHQALESGMLLLRILLHPVEKHQVMRNLFVVIDGMKHQKQKEKPQDMQVAGQKHQKPIVDPVIKSLRALHQGHRNVVQGGMKLLQTQHLHR